MFSYTFWGDYLVRIQRAGSGVSFLLSYQIVVPGFKAEYDNTETVTEVDKDSTVDSYSAVNVRNSTNYRKSYTKPSLSTVLGMFCN